MEEPLDISVTCPFNFRGSDYMISLECHRNSQMMVQVEDSETGDQWRASFDAAYIEGLTHKTGNFKQFNIFANMLETAISKASESVTLDLLTFTDLESLRQKKAGGNYTSKPSVPSSRASQLTSKRYLILTYTVEFDRIHYPLPLPYVGKPDPRALQEEVQMLRVEMQKMKLQTGGDNRNENNRTDKQLRDIRRLEREKAELEEEFAAFRREVRSTNSGTAAKDIRALKAMVRNLEEQLMKEKTRHQRSTSKRSQEYRDLLEEVEELRASERNLRVRLKSLTNELALYKRGRTLTRTNSKERMGSGDRMGATRNTSGGRQRSISNDRLPKGRSGSGSRGAPARSGSRERPSPLQRSNSSEQISRSSLNGSRPRARSNSFDRNTSVNRSRLSTGSGGNRSRSPSPAVSRRFNPTAYIKEKERRQVESSLKRKREQRSNISGRSKGSANSSRNSGYSQRLSRENSINSQASDGYASDGSYTTRQQRLTDLQKWGQTSPKTRSNLPPRGRLEKHILTKGESDGEEHGKSKPFRIKSLASTPELNYGGKTRSRIDAKNIPTADSGDDSETFDRSAEISEIDERLDRLQQLMKVAMP